MLRDDTLHCDLTALYARGRGLPQTPVRVGDSGFRV